VAVHLTLNPSFKHCRWERVKFGGPLVTQFDNPQCTSSQYIQFFYCEFANMAQNGPQYYRTIDVPRFCGTWGCLIHDGGNDTTGSPHDHGIYVGSGSTPGAEDCWSVCDVIYRLTGYGIQMYEAPTRFLIAHATIDECAYPAGVTERGCIEVGGESGTWSRDCLIVNSLLSTIPNSGNAFAIHTNHPGTPPSSGINVAHHNGYFVDATNEDTSGNPNCIDYQGNNVDADPKYINRTGRNYRLQTDSPMISEGDSAYTPATDFDGKPFFTSDIGAFAAGSGIVRLRSRRPR
jgi:hypothetical protein